MLLLQKGFMKVFAVKPPVFAHVLSAKSEGFRLEGINGRDRQTQAGIGNGLGDNDVGVHGCGGR